MSSLFQHILVPVDLSSCSAAALKLATQVATLHDAKLEVLHAAQCSPSDLRTIEAEVVGFVRAVLGVEATLPLHVQVGPPRDVILAAAKQLGCDAIVLGTHGRTGRAHMLAGSVAESVVRSATCPVVTVRDPS